MDGVLFVYVFSCEGAVGCGVCPVDVSLFVVVLYPAVFVGAWAGVEAVDGVYDE